MAYTISGGRIFSDNIEIPVANHCNLSCRGCDHVSPIARKWNAEVAQVERDLAVLAKCYRATNLRLLGGEPLLNPAIVDIAAVAHASRIATRICLVTNGQLLDRVPARLWRYINKLEISAYGNFLKDQKSVAQVKKRMESLGIALEIKYITKFREPYATVGIPDTTLTQRIYKTCQVAHRWGCHSVYDGFFYKCPQAHSIPEHSGVGVVHKNGIRLDGADVYERLANYLADTTPLAACTNWDQWASCFRMRCWFA